MNRRRAIGILSATAFSSCGRSNPLRNFSSIAFGTEVHFQTHGISQSAFEKISSVCSARIREIEALFSLYDPQSTLSKLNHEGRLDNPPTEFLELIRTALDYGEKTGGIFDITVQPLWDWRQKWKEAGLEERQALHANSWDKALTLVDYRHVKAVRDTISFGKPGMAITLNGIVQGHATDSIVTLLKKLGVRNALVNIGEYAALGTAQNGKPWSVELAANGETIPLPPGRALAVSAGSGHTFDPEGRFHHIFRPADGASTRPDSTIVVTAPTATIADALSTTFTVASGNNRQKILKIFPKADFREIKP
ncbi:MAG: FAD:protein FMN transferase [Verrucomicrobia bacterium]|jgi:thiamine biosynthesis lipoprotein|nr:FAD:protein FMN transferase [Verrucomicrobiota bacterium]|tara:strand:+ start:6547 stop:7470 length:924 start_codon:yes stop_codon:yes gene_type:complete